MKYIIAYVVVSIVGIIVVAIVTSNIIKSYTNKIQGFKNSRIKNKGKIEFSKLILIFVMMTYFVVVGVGVKLSFIDTTQYSTLAMLVGAPTAVAIGFYAWKAKAENVLKLHKENQKETEGVLFDPSNIQP